MGAIDMTKICDDLAAEHAALDGLVADATPEDWQTSTPAEGWTVQDQISHLAYFDERAELAARDPEGFQRELETAVGDVDALMNAGIEAGRQMSGAEVLEWWRTARTTMLDVFRGTDAKDRIAWYVAPMSAVSFATARLMETWAHGQDVADALGVTRDPSDRLRHVAHLGVTARPWSYMARGLEPPAEPVFVTLASPAGEMWTWGDPAADNIVGGSAEEFALVVTRRRHVDDTDLRTQGPLARDWMEHAQAFAGPPGPGRKPGQFA